MSKRRITTQQKQRIQKNQKAQRISENSALPLYDGLVLTRYGRHAEIEYNHDKRIHCSIRPNLEDIIAGDRVKWQKETDEQGVVVSLYPRRSLLARMDARGQSKPIAANLTQVCIVVTEEPMLSWQLLDSYIAMGEFLNLKIVIIVNKKDIVSPTIWKKIKTLYQSLNYPVLLTGFDYPKGDKILSKTLQNETSIFVGQSGVGKSSLIQRLLPHETSILTGAISTSTSLGKHTTSYSRYYHIPTGGALIDSPGIREFNLTLLNVQNLAKCYVEFNPFISQCKFRNCLHIDTPACAIIEAVNKGIILQQRYENYVKICKTLLK